MKQRGSCKILVDRGIGTNVLKRLGEGSHLSQACEKTGESKEFILGVLLS